MICLDVDTALGEVPVNLMPLMDSGDFVTVEEAVAYDAAGMELIWHFLTTAGAYTATVVTPTTGGDYDWAHQDGGMYTIEIPASGGASANNSAEGFGWFTGKADGVLPWRGPTICFRAAGINNKLIDDAYSTTRGLAGTALPDAAANAPNGLPVSVAGGLDLDAKLANTHEITAARMGALTDWIDGNRLDLILDAILANSNGEWIWLDPDAAGGGNGSPGAPYNAFADAYAAGQRIKFVPANPGGTAYTMPTITLSNGLVLDLNGWRTSGWNNVTFGNLERIFSSVPGGRMIASAANITMGAGPEISNVMIDCNTLSFKYGYFKNVDFRCNIAFVAHAFFVRSEWYGCTWAGGGFDASAAYGGGVGVNGHIFNLIGCYGEIVLSGLKSTASGGALGQQFIHLGWGALSVDGTGGIVEHTSHVEITDNSGGNVTLDLVSEPAPWNADWDAEVQSECNDALVALNLDHFLAVATGSSDMTNEVADNSILSRILANGDTSAFDPSTDGLQLIRDEIVTLDGVADTILVDTTQIKADLPSRITKNTALSNFEFLMVDETDGYTAETGLTITAERSIDGAAFAACANSASEVGSGIYKINLDAADLNGNTVTLKFSSSGARTRYITIVTQP